MNRNAYLVKALPVIDELIRHIGIDVVKRMRLIEGLFWFSYVKGVIGCNGYNRYIGYDLPFFKIIKGGHERLPSVI